MVRSELHALNNLDMKVQMGNSCSLKPATSDKRGSSGIHGMTTKRHNMHTRLNKVNI